MKVKAHILTAILYAATALTGSNAQARIINVDVNVNVRQFSIVTFQNGQEEATINLTEPTAYLAPGDEYVLNVRFLRGQSVAFLPPGGYLLFGSSLFGPNFYPINTNGNWVVSVLSRRGHILASQSGVCDDCFFGAINPLKPVTFADIEFQGTATVPTFVYDNWEMVLFDEGNIVLNTGTPAIPELPTWMLLLVGCGVLGMGRRSMMQTRPANLLRTETNEPMRSPSHSNTRIAGASTTPMRP